MSNASEVCDHDTSPRRTDRTSPRWMGNAAGGPLSEVFGVDLTDATVDCRHGRHRGTLAEAVVELDSDGLLLLCRCEHQLLSTSGRTGCGP